MYTFLREEKELPFYNTTWRTHYNPLHFAAYFTVLNSSLYFTEQFTSLECNALHSSLQVVEALGDIGRTRLRGARMLSEYHTLKGAVGERNEKL